MQWLNEPSIVSDQSSFITSTSSLQYINSQLISHGFTLTPGITLDGLSNSDMERVVKCFLALLSQRIQDMERADDLTTKTRTMGYDNDRLKAMHQAALDKAANAEREMSAWKSKASAAEKASLASEKRYKALQTETQRLRTTLQAVRSGAQTEIKKFEKEKDKLLERLGKVADSRPTAQFKCSNLVVLSASESTNMGGGRNYLDIALEDAESARSRLAEENDDLRKLAVGFTNNLQEVVQSTRARFDENAMDCEFTPVTAAMMFPMAPNNVARDKFRSLLAALKETISKRGATSAKPDEDVAKLQELVDTLRSELDRARSHTSEYATQAQTLFDKFVEDKRPQPESDHSRKDSTEQERLEAKTQELEKDRWKVTEAAVKLGNERAALEEQRLQFLEETRAWELQKMVPPTPQPVASSSKPRKDRRKTKSPVKSLGAKISRRKSILTPAKKLVPKKHSPKRRRPSRKFETIAMPPPSPPPPSRETIAKMTSTEELLAACSQASPGFSLSTEFVLPPPSPEASLPSLPKSASEPIPQLNTKLLPAPVMSQPQPIASSSKQPLFPSLLPTHKTPGAKPKPRTMHAYSPVKPSPLSRILMMADDSVEDEQEEEVEKPRFDIKSLARPPLATLMEEDPTSGELAPIGGSARVLTLEEELGIPSPMATDEKQQGHMGMGELGGSPLKEKNARRSPSPRKAAVPMRRPTTVAAAKAAVPGKGKAREVESSKPRGAGKTRTAAAAGLDKENSAAKRLKPSPPSVASSSSATSGGARRPVTRALVPGARTRSAAAAGRGTGPRRVLDASKR